MLYTDAFLAEMAEALRALVPLWGLPQDGPLALLTVSENATWLAGEGDGRIVLRVQRPGYNSDAAIASELVWSRALREDGVVNTPASLPARTGEDLLRFDCGGHDLRLVAFEFVPGAAPSEEEHDLAFWYRRLGAITAGMHRHSRSWRMPDGFSRRQWGFAEICGPAADWGDWRHGIGLDAEGRAVLEEVEADLARRCADFGSGPDRQGLIHCDMRTANLLVDGDHMTVIDFDDCGFGWYVYDFAAATSFMPPEAIWRLLPHWVAGYREVLPLDAEDEAALPMFVMLRRLQLTGWIASHADAPEPAALGAGFTHETVAMGRRWLEEIR